MFDGEAISAQPRFLKFVSRVGTFVENMVAMRAARDFSSRLEWKASANACGSMENALDMLVANCSMVAPIWLPIVVDSCVIIEVIAFVIASCMTWPMTALTPFVRVVPSWAAICAEIAFMTWVDTSVPIWARAGSSPRAFVRFAASFWESTTWSEETAARNCSITWGWEK